MVRGSGFLVSYIVQNTGSQATRPFNVVLRDLRTNQILGTQTISLNAFETREVVLI
ncbi:hypothetical protein CLOTH_16310 [Alkalithermobacter paradoxus]|uniref:Uncharacterized protein n=1 Tax=Alkalithermobacter paradoxus TaxID=29349 RepID=A0A1V4I5R4_9FIRM|nr:hypothetical protein CLOTH_16310 [[Clostridium] thermoalcaliphilum]